MTNPAIWLSISGAIYGFTHIRRYNDNEGWGFFCAIICIVSIVYNCIISKKHSTEKAETAIKIVDVFDGYITRMIPVLNMFFDMQADGRLMYKPIFKEGDANEVRVDLDYEFLLAGDVDKKTEALAQIVQGFFDTDFKIPANFASCLKSSIKELIDADAPKEVQAFLFEVAKNPEKIRPDPLDVKRFNRAVFIVHFFVKGELIAVRTFHINPNQPYIPYKNLNIKRK